VGVITDVTSPTTATLHVLEPFASTTLAAGAWTLEDSPQVSLAVMYQDPVLGLAMDAGGAVGVNILANATVPGAATGTPFWTQSDVGLHIREVGSGTGSAIIESLDSSTYIRLTIDTAFSSGSLPPGNWEIEGSSKGAYQPLVHIRVKDGFSGFHPEEQSGRRSGDPDRDGDRGHGAARRAVHAGRAAHLAARRVVARGLGLGRRPRVSGVLRLQPVAPLVRRLTRPAGHDLGQRDGRL
jgi:hypothetical protein